MPAQLAGMGQLRDRLWLEARGGEFAGPVGRADPMAVRNILPGPNPGAFAGLTDGLVAFDPPGEVRRAFDSLIPSFMAEGC